MFDFNNYKKITDQCEASGSKLVAVTKNRSIEELNALYQAGHRAFGENRVQDLLYKKKVLPSDIEWHLIGTIQSNKIKQIVGQVKLIHSIDSLPLIQKLESHCSHEGISQDILLQFNISSEDSKHGFIISETFETMRRIQDMTLSKVNIIGLMGMGGLSSNDLEIESQFLNLKTLQSKLLEEGFTKFTTLSMGMSSDYELALKHGSSMVRVGSLLFS